MNESFLGSSVSRNESPKKEGPVAKAIESQTAKIPSDLFLWAAGAALIGSAAFQLAGTRRRMMGGRPRVTSLFIGQWVPTLLLLGIYNKIVKVAGSDRMGRD